MATIQKWHEVTVRIPIDVEYGDAGLVYLTSPLLKGLFIANQSEEEAFAILPKVIENMGTASAAKPPKDAI